MKLGYRLAAVCLGACSTAALADVTGDTGSGTPFSTVQRSVALTPLVRLSGIFPSEHGSPVGTIGEITWFAGNFAPGGYARAEGQLLSIAQNTALFSLLGTTYGGNGQTTFALPDLRGRTPIGAGQGPGLSDRVVGQAVGAESVTLVPGNLPPHSHGVNTEPPVESSVVGAGLPYENMQPSLAINYVVPQAGVFPSRDGGGYVGSEPVLGFVYATAQASVGFVNWTPASGQIQSIAQNTALFSLLGTTYGGNGQTTFALPDLRGRAPVGAGTGPGWDLGQISGQEQSSLSLSEMAAHDHATPSIGGATSIAGGSLPQDTAQPGLGLRYVIALQGVFPSQGGGGAEDEPLLGQVNLFAGNFAPSGWAFCEGQLLSIAQNTALFAVLGTTYGGNGQTTFALPDLRGAIPVGAGVGPFSTWSLGEVRGSDTVTLTPANLAAHAHTFEAVPEPASIGLAALGAVGVLARRRNRSAASSAR